VRGVLGCDGARAGLFDRRQQVHACRKNRRGQAEEERRPHRDRGREGERAAVDLGAEQRPLFGGDEQQQAA
jgi:hypothetical protein